MNVIDAVMSMTWSFPCGCVVDSDRFAGTRPVVECPWCAASFERTSLLMWALLRRGDHRPRVCDYAPLMRLGEELWTFAAVCDCGAVIAVRGEQRRHVIISQDDFNKIRVLD